MIDDHERTEHAELREKTNAAEAAHKAAMERIAPNALIELLSRSDRVIYSHTDDEQGSVQVVRQTYSDQEVVVKSYAGWRTAMFDEETNALLHTSQKGLKQVIRSSRIETAVEGLAGTRQTITMPYVGLDLEKWESLFHQNDSNNPFLRVSFHLRLAISMLTALEQFHKHDFVHCDVKLNNWCVSGKVPALPVGVGQNPKLLSGEMNLSKLTLIDLGFAMTDRPSGRKLIEKGKGIFIAVGEGNDHVARSYLKAVALAGKTGDFAHLACISWKADLFSLGELFAKLLDSYERRLVSDSGPAHLEFLRLLPDRLRSYEMNPEWAVANRPHAKLISEIMEISPLSLNQDFGILVSAEDIAALNDAPHTGDSSPLAAPLPPIQSGAQSEIGQIHAQRHQLPENVPRKQVRPTLGLTPFRLTAILAALITGTVAVWALFGRTPIPVPLHPVSVTPLTRSNPVFARCDDLRVNAVAGKTLSRQDYSAAIGRCSEFLELKNSPPELRFDALITRAVAFEKSDRWHEALEDLMLAEAINPKDPGVDLNRSLVLSRQGNMQQAFASLDAAIDKGWRDGPLIEKDTDYDAITKSPSYQSIRIRLSSPK